MGADLYIECLYQTQQEKYRPLLKDAIARRDAATDKATQDAAQEEVVRLYSEMEQNAYFRDSYNASSVAWQMGLSWWSDIIPMLDENGNMQPPQCEIFLTMLENLPLPPFDEFKQKFGKDAFTIVDEENTHEKWYEYFTQKRQTLIEFVKRAISLNTPILMSL